MRQTGVTRTVTALRVAPVKSLGSVQRDRVRLEMQGVPEDRRLFLLRADGSVLTLRQHPQLTRVLPELDLVAGTLSVTFPDGATAISALTPTGDQVHARLFGKDRSGRLLPGPVADALSDYVAEPLRLVLADSTGIGWDEGPVSILGGASADAVAAPAEAGVPATERFRMLVQVDGAEPYEEDSWVGNQVRLGAALVRITHRLQRCVVINHSPATGMKDWNGLKTLGGRGGRDICLGVIAEVNQPGDVLVGDPVEVLTEA